MTTHRFIIKETGEKFEITTNGPLPGQHKRPKKSRRLGDISELWLNNRRYRPDLPDPPQKPKGYDDLIYRATIAVVDAEMNRAPRDRLFSR